MLSWADRRPRRWLLSTLRIALVLGTLLAMAAPIGLYACCELALWTHPQLLDGDQVFLAATGIFMFGHALVAISTLDRIARRLSIACALLAILFNSASNACHGPGVCIALPLVVLLPTMTLFIATRVAAEVSRGPIVPPGVCSCCGYDLRGLPQPRCPECGTPFKR